jgi:hypothetical protein
VERNKAYVVATVKEYFETYENALMNGDVELMTAAFATDPDIIRFGIGDMQRSPDELRQWRANQPPLPAGRTLDNTVVSTFGDDLAIVTTTFTYPGRAKLGRQSQTWLRREGTWSIIHAHVSEIDQAV